MLKEDILQYLTRLNTELAAVEIKGELCLYGGAVMCLAFDARPATKDVDSVFKPAAEIRRAAATVAAQFDLPEDWINDAVKGFLVPHPQETFLELSHLTVYIPAASYMLAMKAISARLDGMDRTDTQFLIRHLGLQSPDEVFDIVEQFYPRGQIKPATRFFIEEMFE